MKNNFLKKLNSEVKNSVWTGYVTYYPHKSAYRQIDTQIIKGTWQGVDKINLYVHVPFCDKKCAYCNLFSTVLNQVSREELYKQYVQKVIQEIEYYSQFIDSNVQVVSLYFGGGTPNVLSCEQIGEIIAKFKQKFVNWSKDVVMCTECAPERLTKEYIKGLSNLGFKRISVGVQTFNKKELIAIKRDFDISIIEKIREWTKECNIELNLDLIYGLPYQTKKSIKENIKKIIQISPDNICVYPLAIKKYTGVWYMNKKTMMSMKAKYKVFGTIRKMLEQSGYKNQTIVRFIKNTAKTTYDQQRLEYQGVATMGVGAGARSYTNQVSYCLSYKVQDNLVKSVIDEYMTNDIKDISLTGFVYNQDEQKRKFVMLSLLDPGVNPEKYKKEFGTNIFEDFEQEFKALQKAKMIKNSNNLLILTKKGRKYCDICADLFVSDDVYKLYKSYKAE